MSGGEHLTTQLLLSLIGSKPDYLSQLGEQPHFAGPQKFHLSIGHCRVQRSDLGLGGRQSQNLTRCPGFGEALLPLGSHRSRNLTLLFAEAGGQIRCSLFGRGKSEPLAFGLLSCLRLTLHCSNQRLS